MNRPPRSGSYAGARRPPAFSGGDWRGSSVLSVSGAKLVARAPAVAGGAASAQGRGTAADASAGSRHASAVGAAAGRAGSGASGSSLGVGAMPRAAGTAAPVNVPGAAGTESAAASHSSGGAGLGSGGGGGDGGGGGSSSSNSARAGAASDVATCGDARAAAVRLRRLPFLPSADEPDQVLRKLEAARRVLDGVRLVDMVELRCACALAGLSWRSSGMRACGGLQVLRAPPNGGRRGGRLDRHDNGLPRRCVPWL
jgi:hypothetical protein